MGSRWVTMAAVLAACGLRALVNSNAVEDHAPRHGRALQTGSNVVWIGALVGPAFSDAQEDAVQLQNAERGDPGDAATTIPMPTTAQVELYFTAPDIQGATGFTLSFVGQLNGADWAVQIYDWAVEAYLPAWTLAGMTTAGWGDVSINFDTVMPANFIQDEPSEVRILLSATNTEAGYLDFAAVTSWSGSTPTPAPTLTPTPTPVAPVAAPTVEPQPPVATPAPAEGVIAVFVEKITGADILAEQSDGGALATAEGAPVTDTTKSIAFAATASAQARYEIYFVAPPATGGVPGPYTISITAQLGAGAVASNWKVDMYSFLPVGSDAWFPVGTLTGVTSGAWTTVELSFDPATPLNFVEPTVSEYLIQLSTEAAQGAETVYLDQILVSTSPGETATPSPVVAATPPPTPAPTVTPTAPPTLPDVEVDLVPCILASEAVVKDVGPVASAYLFHEFYKGFWTATQNVQAPPAAVLDLLVDADHGKCSVIYVGIDLSVAQKTQLQDYSRKFRVRIVYFDVANSIFDPEVIARLGMESRFDEPSVGAPRVKRTGGPAESVVSASLITDSSANNVYNRPVVQIVPPQPGVSILAQYADESGAVIPGAFFDGAENAAIVEYIGDDGLEELHVFIGLAWFDQGSWAWAHFISEWGTKGVFQGERRFYLGAVVDDLFLTTGEWIYDPPNFATYPEDRLSGAQLQQYAEREAAYNDAYNAAVKTEHAFNGLGVLDQVGSAFKSWIGVDADIGLLAKGAPPNPSTGIPQVSHPNWLSTTFNPAPGQTGIEEEYESGIYASDDLLAAVTADLDAFFWQSHTLTHLARDNLGKGDCDIEDAGNARMAILLGLWDSNNYCWRSMTSPGITGLFNHNCLQSGAENLMKCYPGDNTYSGPPLTDVILIDQENQFHSVTTSVGVNGYDGVQIVPRYSTNIYYNCLSGRCLIDENEKIRRDVCGCTELNPALDSGPCPLCPNGIDSFNDLASQLPDTGPLEALFRTEAQTTTRYIMSGRRDKYMFHQANLIPTKWATDPEDPLYVHTTTANNPSLLEYWHIRVLAEMSEFLNTASFPVQTLKFDDLCHNFYQHEWLDGSGAILTATKDINGTIKGLALATTNNNGAPIPLTVPTAIAATISAGFGSLSPSNTEIYGPDTTFVFAAGTLKTGNLSKPAVSELAPIPQATLTPVAQKKAETMQEKTLKDQLPAISYEAERARVKIAEEAATQGFVAEG